MRKIVTFILLTALMCGYQVSGQIQPIGNEDFGRIFDLTYDHSVQNRVYGITLGNHIVVSNDNGIHWSVFYSLPFSEGKNISSLKLRDNGTAVSFVIKNNISDRVVILNLATKTITKSYSLPNSTDNPWVSSYDFYKDNSDILLVDTNWTEAFKSFGKTYVTYNQGNSWTEVYSTIANDNVFINNVAINPVDEHKLYLLRGLGDSGVNGGLWLSSNNGSTWQKYLTGVPLNALDFDPTNYSKMYLGTSTSFGASPENLYKSENGGTVWQTIPITWGSTGILNNINHIRINPYNPQHIIVLEEDEVVVSFDGGNTWENRLYPIDNTNTYYYGLNSSFNPFNNQQVLVSANYKPVISSDGGLTFGHQIETPYFFNSGNVGVFKKNNIYDIYYSVQEGWVHRNLVNNQEENYSQLPLNTVSNIPPYLIHVDKKVAGRLFIFDGTPMASVLKMSSQHGLNQQVLFNMNFTGYLNCIYANPTNTNSIWAAFTELGVGATINKLKKIDISNINNITVDPINFPTNEKISKIIFPNSSNPNEVMISAGAQIYKTLNGGQQWTVMNLTSISGTINDIIQNPLNLAEMAIATEVGIYVSTDSGVNWNLKSPDKVNKIFYSDSNNGKLVAITLSSGTSNFTVYYSTNSGNNWTKVNDNDIAYLASSTIDVVFEDNKADLYIGSQDLGLVKYNLNFANLGITQPGISKDIFSIYPNPTSDELNIKTSKTIAKVNVLDASGRLVITSDKNTLNVSGLNKGTYFLKVDFRDGTIENVKFIKK